MPSILMQVICWLMSIIFMAPLKYLVEKTYSKFLLRMKSIKNKWQDRLWGPAQELKITLHIETYWKNRIKDGRNSTKIGASNIFGGN